MRFPTCYALLTSAFLATPLSAQLSHVVPDGYANQAANSSSAYPWDRRTVPIRVQYCYDSTHFTNAGVNMPILVNRLRWRANDEASTWTGGTYHNCLIQLSSAAVDYLALTTTFGTGISGVGNHGSDLTTVYSGAVNVIPGSGTGRGIPSPWYVDVQLQTPFLYDPTSGQDFLVDLDVDGNWSGNGGTETIWMDVTYLNASPPSNASRLWSGTSGAATGTIQQDVGAVMEVYYSTCNGSIRVGGMGCADSGSTINTIRYSGCPDLGTTLTVEMNTSASATGPLFLIFGLSNQNWGGIVLPLDLTPFGAPGCSNYVSHEFALGGIMPTGGQATLGLQIPSTPYIVGAISYLQFFNVDLGLNPLNLATSDYLTVTCG